jgi:1-acyl-sn-glycerol-3-phosphate acyltransferase
MDPLAILFSIDRHAKFLTRASVFNNPTIAKLLRTIGLLPAYRLSFDGIEAVKNNEDTFSTGERELLKGQPVVIFPEGMHQHTRWLGDFSFGYTKMAFEAAQLSDWQQEIFILPSANHYKHWGHMQSDLVVSFAEPVSLKPYYELYQTKPRTAQREVNKIVRQRISDMMLNIEDTDNYESIEFLSRTYAADYALKNGKNPNDLRDMLWTGRKVVSALAELKERAPEVAKEIFEKADNLNKAMKNAGVRDWLFRERPSWTNICLTTIAMLVLLPLFVVSLIPNIFVYQVPKLILSSIKDWMFRSTLYFGVGLVCVPIFYLMTFVVLGLVSQQWLMSLIYTMLLPFLGLFAWYYRRELIKLVGKFQYQKCVNPKKNADIAPQREVLWTLLEKEII